MPRPSIYEFAGGQEAFVALAEATTKRCIADPELNHAFAQELNPRHDLNLAAYWAEVFGGPNIYSRKLGGHSGMLAIHAGHGTPNDWGDRFAACFIQAIDDAKLPDDPEFRGVLCEYIRWATHQVKSVSPPGSKVEPDQPMPLWSWAGPLA